MGVGRSGAANRRSFRLRARLLGQDCTAAGIEISLGGFAEHAHGDIMLALTGAPARATVDGIEVARHASFVLGHGHDLTPETPCAGLRGYLSARGGVEVPAVLGSRATDVLSGLGPAALKVGDILPVGPSLLTSPTSRLLRSGP